MLDSLIQELDSYTDESFLVANLAVQIKVYYQLYEKGHIDKAALLRQIDTIIYANVNRNNNEISDKIKLDSLIYRIREWLER